MITFCYTTEISLGIQKLNFMLILNVKLWSVDKYVRLIHTIKYSIVRVIKSHCKF